MKKYRNPFLIVFMLVFVMLFSACNKSGKDMEAETTPAPSTTPAPINGPTFGETLKVSIRNPVTLNPLLNEDQSVDQVLKLVFEPLFTIDNQYKPVPHLVERFSIASDNSYISLTLKNNLSFNDGTPLTANDVKYSIEILQNAAPTVIYKSCVDNIQRVIVSDNQNLKIFFKQPFAFSTYYLTFPIVSAENSRSANYDPFKPVGSGYYEIKEFTSMKNLMMTAAEQHKDEIFIENIEVIITRDAEVETNAFDQKLIDMLFPSKFDWFQHSDSNNQKTLSYTTNYFEFLGFNFTNPWLSNAVVRQSIAYGINREEIGSKQFLSQISITDSPIHPQSWLSPKDEKLTYIYDIDKAKNLLGGIDIKDMNKDGYFDQGLNATSGDTTLKLLVNKDNAARNKVAVMIQDYMKKIGFLVEIDAVDKATFNDKLIKGDYDLVLSGWKLSVVPDYSDMFHSTQIAAGTNFIRYNNPQMDQLLGAVFSSPDEAALYANFQKFSDLYVQDLPYFSLYFMNSIVLTNNEVYGELKPTTENVFNGIENLYIIRQK